MTITRRTALKGIGGLAASLLLPSWQLIKPKAPINLAAFCERESYRYDLTKPFVQAAGDEFYRYATDARICVRVDSWAKDRTDNPEVHLPKAETLPWIHDDLDGWRPWPKTTPIVAADSDCLECYGHGVIGERVQECPDCEGDGRTHDASEYWSAARPCERCDGIGWIGTRCPTCKGKKAGNYPGVQYLGHAPVSAVYSDKVLRHLPNAEYCVWHWGISERSRHDVAMIRFDGGTGILMPLYEELARKRIELATA